MSGEPTIHDQIFALVRRVASDGKARVELTLTEAITVALVLDDYGWIKATGLTMLEAFARLGVRRTFALCDVQRAHGTNPEAYRNG